MLTVDLGRLARDGRTRIEADVPADAELWNGLDFEFASPVRLRLEAQRVGAGKDVLVRGTVQGQLAQACRRCLKPVQGQLDLDLALYFEAEVDEVEAQDEDVYALPARGDLDLSLALREQIALALPRYPLCREDCRGLCPHCGTNRNERECDCRPDSTDERWAALRELIED